MSAGDIDTLLELWATTLLASDSMPPFANHRDLYKTIDNARVGDVPWENFNVQYDGPLPEEPPSWMVNQFEVWYRNPRDVINNMLANTDFANEMDTAPFREYTTNGDRRYQHFMSGDWAWNQADIIAQDPQTHGSMFVPIILGSDKTTVSVGTGGTGYYPLYAAIGNTHNGLRRAHRNALVLIGFLSIPKVARAEADTDAFRNFKRQLFHSSINKILNPLRPAMTTPEVVRCFDGHFRRVIYGIGPYIADYQEQVTVGCVVQGWCAKCTAPPDNIDGGGHSRTCEHTGCVVDTFGLKVAWDEYGMAGTSLPFTHDFPRADIHEVLAPDLLHQLIKGVFKDHLVEWVQEYIHATHGKKRGDEILDDIDRRIASAAPFSNLRRFHEGRGFTQWTGDDSKALMKVYLPAIEGYVPVDMVRCIRAFLEFCYIARQDVHDEQSLNYLSDAITRFHQYREIFVTTGIRPDGFSLPRQHSMVHYLTLIRAFGGPNGLCSSITESKHIKAIKEPWRRSSRYKALGQMLLINQRLDKLAALRVDFSKRGMLNGTCFLDGLMELGDNSAGGTNVGDPHPCGGDDEDEGDDGAVEGPTVSSYVDLARTIVRTRNIYDLAIEIQQPRLPILLSHFLYDQLYPDNILSSSDVPLAACPSYTGKICVHNSAVATFHAPSDPSGIGGMHREHIRAVPSWRKSSGRYDCVFVNRNPDLPGMKGMDVVRILLFFSFNFSGTRYPCALVRWFTIIGDEPDEDTGMWIVQPEVNEDGSPVISIIHLDCVIRAAHLIGVFGNIPIPKTLLFAHSLDSFKFFYVNRFIHHHAFKTIM